MKRFRQEWRDYVQYFTDCLINGMCPRSVGSMALWYAWIVLATGTAAMVWKHHHSVLLSLAVGVGTFVVETLLSFAVSKCLGRSPTKDS